MKEYPIPANEVAEKGVISCLLNNPKSITKVADRLKPGHFYYDGLGHIYESIQALYEHGKLPSIPNVAAEMVRREMRGPDVEEVVWELRQFEDSIAIFSGIEDHVDVVLRCSQNRRLLQVISQIADSAYRQEEGSVARAEELIMAIAMDSDIKGASSMADMVDRYLRTYAQRRKDAAEGRVPGVKTGFYWIDQMTRLRPGTLNILAARTGEGKTALALNFALNIVKKSRGRVLFFSLEMKEEELIQRLLSQEAHVDQILLRDGKTTEDEDKDVMAQAQELRPLDLHVVDNAYRLDNIKSIARVMHNRKPLDLIVIDYLQLVDIPPEERGRQKARYEEVGETSKGAKRLAQELNVPVLMLAQVSREGGKSGEPELHHLGESGRIENDADTVAFIHVPEESLEKQAASMPYAVHYLVKKDRQGRKGSATLMFLPPETRFTDIVL
jgi:replicative DNA helicase